MVRRVARKHRFALAGWKRRAVVDAAQLRPLSIGEILDVAIKIYQARFAHLVTAVAVVVGPVSLVGALIQASAAPDTDEFLTTTDTAVGSSVDFGDFWGLAAGFLLSALLGFIAAEIATAASFKLVSGAYLDTDPDWRESLRFATSRLRSLVWLSIVSGVLMGLAFLACIVPGVYFYGAWAVAVPVLLLEEHRGSAGPEAVAGARDRALVADGRRHRRGHDPRVHRVRHLLRNPPRSPLGG